MKVPLSCCVVLTAFVFFGTGCATLVPSIVKKPDILAVKKVALVSITAPQTVPHKGGKGMVHGWGEDNRKIIADQTLAAYEAEFKKLGWALIPSSQLSSLAAYKDNFAPRLSQGSNKIAKTLNALSASDSQHGYFSPTGLYPVVWEGDKGKGETLKLDLGTLSIEKPKPLKDKMQEVAAQAGADAAVLVQADYCYDDGAIWVGKVRSGTGTAVLTAASAIYAVTPKGVEVIKMKRIASPCSGDSRVGSDTSTTMVKGQLLYKDETIRKMFQEVAKKAASENVKQLQRAMK